MKKTLEKWEAGKEMDLEDYLQPMDEIDYDLYAYSWAWVSPYWSSNGFIQWGEPNNTINDVYYRMTFATVNERYYYLGILPEFRND